MVSVKKMMFLLALLLVTLLPMLAASPAFAQEGVVEEAATKSEEFQVEPHLYLESTLPEYRDTFWQTLTQGMAEVPEGAEFEIDEKTGQVTIISLPAVPEGVTCSGSRCTGKDPQTTGCSAGAYRLGATQPIVIRGTIYALGFVELRYSPVCKTKWSRVTSIRGSLPARASLRWSQDPWTRRYGKSGTANPNFWSLQVYSTNPQWKACGGLNPNDPVEFCTHPYY